VLDAGAGVPLELAAERIVNQANSKLEPHQRIRGFSVWPNPSLPRTSGTNKLKRVEIAGAAGGRGVSDLSPTDTEIPESSKSFPAAGMSI